MKQLLIFLLIFTGLIDIFSQNKSVVVAGNIIEPKSKLIAIRYEQTLFEKKKRFIDKVDTTGFFSIRFILDYPQNVSLLYNDELLTLFLHPGDSIYLSFNGKKRIESVHFSGSSSIQNSKIYLFDKEYEKIFSSEAPFKKVKELPPITFKRFINDFQFKCDSLIYSLNADKEISNWMKFNIKYRCFEFLYEYGRDNEIEFTDSYYDFINKYFQDNQEGLCHTSYSDFVDSYMIYNLSVNKSVNDSLENYYKNKNYNSYLKQFISFCSQLNTDLSKSAIMQEMHQFLNTDIKTVENLFNTCAKVLKDEQYIELLKREIENYKIKLEKEYITINKLASNEFVGPLFTDISKKHSGKVLYIDFWGIGCSPCIKEFPYAKTLHESLLSEDVVFVYLCQPSKKEIWDERIKKYEIQGENYLLTSDQWKYLQYLLDFGGTPRYMIVNKKGQFVNTDSDRPSDGVAIKNELIKYTKK